MSGSAQTLVGEHSCTPPQDGPVTLLCRSVLSPQRNALRALVRPERLHRGRAYESRMSDEGRVD